MSGYVNPMFRPDFTDYPAPPQNRLASGFNAIWPSSNPVGTETTQGMQSATPTDQIAFMRPDGTPVMQSDLARAHEQVQTAMQVAPTMVLGMMGTTDPAGIRAFHGSPYDFERFDTSKIGTGEGAQAYGHGLYMAGNENVAQSYKMAGPAADAQVDAINQQLTQLSKQMDQYSAGQYGKYNDPKGYELKAQYDALMDKRAALGHMYEVSIGADPEQFLHWDKPLSEQSAAFTKVVQDAAQQPGFDPHEHLAVAQATGQHPRNPGASYQPTGQELMDDLSGIYGYHRNSADLAEHLRDAGIPGIRYLDQGSRGAGEGTHNYVVFDANTIDILRKYGLAGLGIGLGTTAAGTQQQSQ